jgi:hypothetical protein
MALSTNYFTRRVIRKKLTKEGKQTMAFEQKPNSGSLFRNEKMREGKQDAEYTGSALINGVEYFVNAWVNEIKSGERQGKKYFNMHFKTKQQQSSSQQTSDAHDDRDVPFF